MPKVNYITEHRAFIRYASDERITANEFILYEALFELFNERAVCNVWPDGFVPLPNGKVLALTVWGSGNSSNETLRKTRDRLLARGLIDYIPGEKRRKAPLYRLRYFTAQPVDEPVDNDGFTHEKVVKPLGNAMGKPLGNAQGIKEKDQTQTGPLTHMEKPLPHHLRAEGMPRAGTYRDAWGEDQPCRYDEAWMTSARARGAVAQRLIDGYGGDQDAQDLWGELCSLMADGLPPELVEDEMPRHATARLLLSRLQALYLHSGYAREREGMKQRADWAQLVKSCGGSERAAHSILRLRAQIDQDEEAAG